VIWGCRAAIDAFRTGAFDGVRGGELAIIASLSAHGPVPGLSVYAATKAAVLSLATSLDTELRRDGVAVHAICPDGVNTVLLTGMADDSQGKALVPSGKLYQPQDIAEALVAMFGTKRVYRTLPAWRGVMLRTTGVFPGPTMRLEPVMRRWGARRARNIALI